MLVRLLHFMGLTNSTDEEVDRYLEQADNSRPSSISRAPSTVPLMLGLATVILCLSISSYASLGSQERLRRSGDQAEIMYNRTQSLQDDIEGLKTDLDSVLSAVRVHLEEIEAGKIMQDQVAAIYSEISNTSEKLEIMKQRSIELRFRSLLIHYSGDTKLQVGALSTPDKTKIYKPNEWQDLIEDAEKLIETAPPINDFSRKIWVDGSSAPCKIGPGGCFDISFGHNIDDNGSPGKARLATHRLEFIFRDEEIDLPENFWGRGEEKLALSFNQSGENLCDWLNSLSEDTVRVAQATK